MTTALIRHDTDRHAPSILRCTVRRLTSPFGTLLLVCRKFRASGKSLLCCVKQESPQPTRRPKSYLVTNTCNKLDVAADGYALPNVAGAGEGLRPRRRNGQLADRRKRQPRLVHSSRRVNAAARLALRLEISGHRRAAPYHSASHSSYARDPSFLQLCLGSQNR